MKWMMLSAGSVALAMLTGLTLASNREMLVIRRVPIGGHEVVVREARPVKLPAVPGSPVGFDCNNALLWDRGTLYCFSSHEHPFRSSGRDLFHLADPPSPVSFENDGQVVDAGRWIEAVHRSESGRVYMWYHEEPHHLIPARTNLTIPRIGQMYSDDNGLHWHNQGIVLEAPANDIEPGTTNKYFAGGNGDFSVIVDRAKEYLYILFSTYHREVSEQGVAVARLRLTDLEHPAGRVSKWYAGAWNEPGLGGRVTPIFRAEADWHSENARAFWGPSVHWNSQISAYVVLMNRTKNSQWDQDGVFIAVNDRLDDPSGWSEPKQLLDATDWYPQVIGTNKDRLESDREAGATARLFVHGESLWQLEFH